MVLVRKPQYPYSQSSPNAVEGTIATCLDLPTLLLLIASGPETGPKSPACGLNDVRARLHVVCGQERQARRGLRQKAELVCNMRLY